MIHNNKLRNRIFSLVLALVMVLGMMPTVALAAGTPMYYESIYLNSAYRPAVYANGTDLIIEAGSNGTTSVYYMNGNTKTAVVENTDLSNAYIFAGYESSSGRLTDDVTITMNGGNVDRIYTGHSTSGSITGNVTIIMEETARVNEVLPTSSAGNITISGKQRVFAANGKYGGTNGGHSFDGQIVKTSSGWSVSGNAVVPAGCTMTIDSGTTVTVANGTTIANNGAIINNGTIMLEGGLHQITGNVVTGSGKLMLNLPYIQAESFSSISIRVNGNEVTGDNLVTQLTGNVFLNVPQGAVYAVLDGKEYYGVFEGNAVELVPYTGVTDITVSPVQVSANSATTLVATASPSGVLSQSYTFGITDPGTTGATLSGDVLTVKYGGTASMYVTATDGYDSYTDTFAVTVNQTAVTGIDADIPQSMTLSPITLNAQVIPSSATYKDIVWSVSEGPATVSGNSLKPTGSGTVKLTATVKNGVAYGQDFTKTYTIMVKAPTELDISKGSITITKFNENQLQVVHGTQTLTYSNDTVISITGSSTTNSIKINSGSPKLVLNNCSIDVSGNFNIVAALDIASGASADVTLLGENSLKGVRTGIAVPSGASIVIDGSGSLTATATNSNCSGIGGNTTEGYTSAGSITINGGTVISTGGYIGIGSSLGGCTVIINGGIVTANGIQGKNGSINITINGGTVTSTASSSHAAIGTKGWSDTGATIIVKGGNINASSVGSGVSTPASTVQDNAGNNIVLKTITLYNAASDTAVTELKDSTGNSINYSLKDVYTTGDKLYFYLPDNIIPATITADGVEYFCKDKNSLTYYTEHDWSNNDGECAHCGTLCTHQWQGDVCNICGKPSHDHIYTDNNGFCTVCNGYQRAILNQNGVYEISNAGQLMWFAEQINSGAIAKNANAILKDDIDMNGIAWTPICSTGLYYSNSYASGYGTADTGYAGTFDGDGHVIKNLSVTAIANETWTYGLFGTMTGTVKNLGIEGFTYSHNGATDMRTGAIVGQNLGGTIENCYVVKATITPGTNVAGGITGCNYAGTIKNCYVADSTVLASDSRYGYIAGDNRADTAGDRVGTIENCYTDGDRLVGSYTGTETNSGIREERQFASGEITYQLNGGSSDGIWKLNASGLPAFTGDTVYQNTCGGDIFYSTTDGDFDSHVFNTETLLCTNCKSYEPATLVTAENYSSLGLDESYVGYYAIENASNLYWYSERERIGDISGSIVLLSDITIDNSKAEWVPIVWEGDCTFDGRGNTITLNLDYGTTQRSGNYGLFGTCNYSVVKNLYLDGNIKVNTTGHVGAVAGSMYRTTVSGVISTANVTNTCTTSGSVGGLAGCFGGQHDTAKNQYSKIENSAVYANVTGYNAGGLVGEGWGGYQYWDITNAAYVGKVTTNNTTSGTAGAIVGYQNTDYNTSTFTNIYWNQENGLDFYGRRDTANQVHTNTEAKTKAQFASGEVAYLLGSAWGQILGTDAHPVIGGETVYQVNNCKNDTVYSNTNENIGHIYADGICTVCGEADPDYKALFNLAGANLELANDITMYFYVYAKDVADGYYMEIVKTNADGSKVTKKVEKSDWTAYGSTMYYVGFNGMAAKEMADEIAVTVYNAEGAQVSNTTTTSISAYALRALDNAAYASMHTMMADLLNYGAAAQTFFKYNTANLANADMTETHQALATKGFDMSKYTNDVVVGAGVVGANLSLETNILQNFYFDPAVVDSTMTAVVTYTNYKGVEKTARISGDKFGTMPGYGYIIVEVSVLVPADVMSLVSVEIVNAEGTVVASVSDSISSYAVRANTNSPDALYIELMEYCLSCEAYFG